MKLGNCVFITLWIFIVYIRLQQSKCDEESSFACNLSDTISANERNIIAVIHVEDTKCNSHNMSCVDEGRLWYLVVKTVQLLSHNMSWFYNDYSSNVILQKVCNNHIKQINFYMDKVVIHSSSILNTSLQFVCNYSNISSSSRNQTKPTEANAVVSVLRYVKWQKMVLFYDSQSVSIASTVALTLSHQCVFLTLYNIDNYNDGELTMIMSNLNIGDIDAALNITIICHTQSCLRVFQSAQNFDHTNVQDQMRIQHVSMWIVFSYSDFTQEELNSIQLDNVLFLNQISMTTVNNCKEGTISTHSDVFLSLESLLWEDKGRGLTPVGSISSTGETSHHGNLYPNTEYGLNRRMIRVTTIEWGMCATIDINGNVTGLCIDILNALAQKLNFTYEVFVPPDNVFGTDLPNGTWTGMVGMIQRDKADLVASTLTINTDREKVIDFTYPIIFDYVTVVFAKPRVNKWRTLLSPYSDLVYALMVVSLLLVSLIFFLLERWHPKYSEVSSKPPPNLYHCFWYMFGALLSQGGENLTTSAAGRTIISSWWIFCIISIAVYSGNLTATLAINKEKLPFTSVEEMVKQKVYKWGTLGNSAYPSIFKGSPVASYAKIWTGIVEFNKTDPGVLSTSAAEHYRKVVEGNYAFIMGREFIDFETSNNSDLIILDESISPDSLAFAMSNNSPFVRMVSDALISFHENGFIWKWKSVRWPQPQTDDSKSYTTKRISAEEMQSSFYLIALGISVSCIVIMCEHLLKKYHNHKLHYTTRDNCINKQSQP